MSEPFAVLVEYDDNGGFEEADPKRVFRSTYEAIKYLRYSRFAPDDVNLYEIYDDCEKTVDAKVYTGKKITHKEIKEIIKEIKSHLTPEEQMPNSFTYFYEEHKRLIDSITVNYGFIYENVIENSSSDIKEFKRDLDNWYYRSTIVTRSYRWISSDKLELLNPAKQPSKIPQSDGIRKLEID